MLNILVVDDEASYRDSLGMILGLEGFRVATARNGREALQQIQGNPPDVLIVDWVLRDEMDGLAVLAAVRQLLPKLFAIFMTGYPTPTLRATVDKIPLTTFLEKPFALTDLIAAIQMATGSTKSTKGPGPYLVL